MVKGKKLDEFDNTDYERMKKVREDTLKILETMVWYDYSTANEIFDELDVAWNQAEKEYQNKIKPKPTDLRRLSFFLTAPKNSGKTTLWMRYVARRKYFAKRERKAWRNKYIVNYECAVETRVKRMFAAILVELGGPKLLGRYLQSISVDVVVDKVIETLAKERVRFLFIDEIHNLVLTSKTDKKHIFSGLKKIINKSYTRIVLSGTPNVVDLFEDADFVDERFRPLELPPWSLDREYASLMKSIWRSYNDYLPEWNLYDPVTKDVNEKVALKIYEISEGRLGRILQTVRYAAVSALLNNRKNMLIKDYESLFEIKGKGKSKVIKKQVKKASKQKRKVKAK